MTPDVEPSPYHDHQPLLRDLRYYLVDGVPVLDKEPGTPLVIEGED